MNSLHPQRRRVTDSRPVHGERVHVHRGLGHVRLQALTVEQVNTFYADLLASGLSPASVRRIHATLHRALRDARRTNRLRRNPTDDAVLPRVEPEELAVWTPADVQKFLAHIEPHSPSEHALYALAIATGMRRGELLGLRWADVDLDLGEAHIQQTLIVTDHIVSYGQPKTHRGRRPVALDAGTTAILKRHRADRAERKLFWGAAWTETDLVFDRGDGVALHPSAVSKRFVTTTKAAGMSTIRFHDLRHTAASLMLMSGANPKVVSERLGHATVGFTLDRYSHLLPGLQQDAAERASALIYGAGSTG